MTTNAKQLLRLYQQRRKQEDEDDEEGKTANDRDDDDESTSTSPVTPPSHSRSDSNSGYPSSDSLSVLDSGADGLSLSAVGTSGLAGSKAPQPPLSQLSLAEISMASADCGTNVLDTPDNHHSNEETVAAAPRCLRSICFVCKSPSNLRCTGCR